MSLDSRDAPQIIELVNKGLTFTPYEFQWVPASARFVILGITPKGKGALKVYSLDGTDAKLLCESEKEEGLKCGTFGASLFEDRHLATGDYKGKLDIWDLENLDRPTYSVQAHSSIINCIDGIGGLNIGSGAPEIVTGSRDGCVRVWDPRQEDPVASLEPAPDAKVRDCWSVCFGNSYDDSHRNVAAGFDNGDIKLFDLRVNRVVWETNVKNGVVGMEFDRKDIEMNKLVVATLESRFRLFDMRTMHPELGYSSLVEKAHKSTCWMGKHLPQNRDLFMTCGGNGSLNMWKYSYPDQRSVEDLDGKLKGVMGEVQQLNSQRFSTQPVVSFEWHPDKTGLCGMVCLDQTIRIGMVTKLNKY